MQRSQEQAGVDTEQASVLLREDRGGVTTLTLNRPQQYNALSEELLDSLARALEAVASERDVRVVVVAGSGRAFCAGHDLRQMRAHPERAYYEDLFARCSRVMRALGEIPQPVIARVHGVATAAGCQLVAACDLAVAAESARFATSGVNLGLFCSTPAVAVSRNLPRKRAFEMLVTGDFLDAQTALDLGLVNRVVPEAALDEAVADLAGRIVAKSPVAISTGKRMFYAQLGLSIGEAYEYAGRVMAENMMAEDACEGVDAFLEKREPRWQGR